MKSVYMFIRKLIDYGNEQEIIDLLDLGPETVLEDWVVIDHNDYLKIEFLNTPDFVEYKNKTPDLYEVDKLEDLYNYVHYYMVSGFQYYKMTIDGQRDVISLSYYFDKRELERHPFIIMGEKPILLPLDDFDKFSKCPAKFLKSPYSELTNYRQNLEAERFEDGFYLKNNGKIFNVEFVTSISPSVFHSIRLHECKNVPKGIIEEVKEIDNSTIFKVKNLNVEKTRLTIFKDLNDKFTMMKDYEETIEIPKL